MSVGAPGHIHPSIGGCDIPSLHSLCHVSDEPPHPPQPLIVMPSPKAFVPKRLCPYAHALVRLDSTTVLWNNHGVPRRRPREGGDEHQSKVIMTHSSTDSGWTVSECSVFFIL
jgi:hypothetical protein